VALELGESKQTTRALGAWRAGHRRGDRRSGGERRFNRYKSTARACNVRLEQRAEVVERGSEVYLIALVPGMGVLVGHGLRWLSRQDGAHQVDTRITAAPRRHIRSLRLFACEVPNPQPIGLTSAREARLAPFRPSESG